MYSIRNHVYSIIAFVAFAAISCGQSVSWSPAGGTLQQGKSNTIELRFESCEPTGGFELPEVDGLTLQIGSPSSNTLIVNGRRSSSFVYPVRITPSRLGEVVIPFFEVETNIGVVPIQSIRFEVVTATVGDTGISPEEVFLSRFQIHDSEIYVGEVFDLSYFAGAKQEYQLASLSEPNWNPPGFVISGLKETQSGGLDWQGSRYTARAYETKAMATESGTIRLPGVTQSASVVVGRRRDFLFSEPIYDTFEINSDPFELEIKPLPENAPTSFTGAIGKFTLESRIVPEEVQMGEPITWTLELAGTGNWPSGIGVPSRAVSNSFQAIQPEIKNEFSEDQIFIGKQIEDIVLVPKREGSFSFGPVEYTFFDPAEASYRTISIPAKTVTVTPIQSNSSISGNAAFGGNETDTDFDMSPSGENSRRRSPSLPKELVTGISPLPVPIGQIVFTTPLLLIATVPIALWLLLAFARSIYLDANKGRRKAYRQLKSFNSKYHTIANTKEEQLIWRKIVAAYWGISTEEPTPNDIERAVANLETPELAAKWKLLWQESDRALFRNVDIDSSSWKKQFDETLKASPKPRRKLSGLGTRRAWFGTATLFILSMVPTDQLKAEDAQALYDEGKFEDAANIWVSKINETPDVWELRYNAGLAKAQQEQWGKAWAHWTSAFCLNPNDDRIVWNLKLSHTHTAAYDDTLQSLLENEGTYRIIRLRSPAGWEAFGTVSLWIAAALVTLAVLAIYLPFPKGSSIILFSLGVCAILSALFGEWARSKYEFLASPDTVLITAVTPLRSVPSDLEADQLDANISEGTIAKAQRSFMGWTKIELPNGDIGWLRKESYTPLYGPISYSKE